MCGTPGWSWRHRNAALLEVGHRLGGHPLVRERSVLRHEGHVGEVIGLVGIRLHRTVLVTKPMLRQEATRAFTSLAVQADRVWRLLPDVWRLVSGSARTVRWLVAPGLARPGIALLEGEAFVRPGSPSAYRMRVHNPRAVPESLRVLVRGWSDSGGAPAFTVEWHATLEAHGSAEQWVRTSWCGDATLLDGPPRDATLPWTAGDAQGRWTVEACVARGRARDWLRIGGTLVR